MRAIRNRVYGNTVTGVQIPPHPPILNPPLGGFFFAYEPSQTSLSLVFVGRDSLFGI